MKGNIGTEGLFTVVRNCPWNSCYFLTVIIASYSSAVNPNYRKRISVCPIGTWVTRKLWKGSGTGSTRHVSGILEVFFFLRKLNNTLGVLKGRKLQELRCRANVPWDCNHRDPDNTGFSGKLPGEMRWKAKESWEKKRARERESEIDELLLLVHSVQRTWARFRKRYGCWRLICVWRKWRERKGRNHTTGRKRLVEVMAGVRGGGSRLLSDSCLLNTQTCSQSFAFYSFLFP